MISAQVAKKYGTALFQVARQADQVEEIFDDLRAIREYVQSDGSFIQFIRAPQIPDSDKEAVVKAAFGDQVSRPVYEFLVVLNEKRRLPMIEDIIEYFEQLYLDEIGVVKAIVTTAVPLSPELLDRLTGRLENVTGKTVRTVTKVDPGIIGGVVVVLHNKVIDRSIRYQMQQLKERLMALKVFQDVAHVR